jgi:hypothetical protein
LTAETTVMMTIAIAIEIPSMRPDQPLSITPIIEDRMQATTKILRMVSLKGARSSDQKLVIFLYLFLLSPKLDGLGLK